MMSKFSNLHLSAGGSFGKSRSRTYWSLSLRKGGWSLGLRGRAGGRYWRIGISRCGRSWRGSISLGGKGWHINFGL